MSFFPIELNIPAADHNPSTDQPDMQANTNNMAAIWDVDHLGFNQNLGGYHDIIHMPSNATPAALPGPPAIGQVFCQTVGSDIQLFYESAAGIVSQLTSGKTPLPIQNGYTFLPGGLLLQWGIASVSVGLGNFNFNTPFKAATNAFSVVMTPIRNSSSVDIVYYIASSNTAATYRNTSSSITSVSWFAIGLV